mgnify:CR=1 FL=1
MKLVGDGEGSNSIQAQRMTDTTAQRNFDLADECVVHELLKDKVVGCFIDTDTHFTFETKVLIKLPILHEKY